MAMKKRTVQPENWDSMEKHIAKKKELKAAAAAALENERKEKAKKQKAETRALQRACQQQKNMIKQRKKMQETTVPEVRPELIIQREALLHREKQVAAIDYLLREMGLAHPDSARQLDDSEYR